MSTLVNETRNADFLSQITALAIGKTVVWDFDGVVADTEPLQDASYRVLTERRGWSPREGYFIELVGRTEEQIWQSLAHDGFPLIDEITELKAERMQVFIELTATALKPSWLARELMPMLEGIAHRQVIVSNGDPDVIEKLLLRWGLLQFVAVARRSPGRDKAELLNESCHPGSVLLEDNRGWLAQGRELGATTIGVFHGYNRASKLDADYLVEL